MALATPLMPVNQTTAEISWPQHGVIRGVEAPLVSYVPIDLTASIPCSAITQLTTAPDAASKSVLLSTLPKQADKSADRGLFIRTTGTAKDALDTRSVEVVIRNTPLVSATFAQLRAQPCTRIDVSATADEVRAEFVGTKNSDGQPLTGSTVDHVSEHYDADQRPQVTGLFTDLSGPAGAVAGLKAHVTIDSRYNTPPTLLKWIVLIVGVIATLVSLVALAALDSTDSRRHRRIFPARWWRLNPRDYVVLSALLIWHFIGPNTSDDGYLLTMAKVAEGSGYTANYFRWYGAPEAPFGWYYQVFGWLSHVSLASPWLRLPALACGVVCWLIVSHEVLPRLGRAAARSSVGWTSAFVFLAMWFPFNNGLRPEPIICLGALLTWCSVERAIATGRLLPFALACLIGAFSLAAGPTGLLAVAALVAGARPMIIATIKRAKVIDAATRPDAATTHRGRWASYLALLAPILAAGTFVIFVVFQSMTLTSFLDASAMKTALGPTLHWYNEIDRYSSLFAYSADGSIARRFAVLAMLLSLVVSGAVMIRRSRIPGTALGPSRRIVGITFASLLFLMFTPTKWTHHFGVFAGLGAALAAIAAVAVGNGVLHSRRNRTIFAALTLFIAGLAFTAPNSFYYSSAWGMPWGVEQVTFGLKLSDVLLYASLLLLALALWFHLREPFAGRDPRDDAASTPASKSEKRRRALPSTLRTAPLAYVAAAVVLFEMITAVFAGIQQSTSYSVPRTNLEALTGKECGMADKVYVESDPSSYLLSPVDKTLTDPLFGPKGTASTSVGFTANGVPEELNATASAGSLGVLAGAAQADPDVLNANTGGTGGGEITKPGINGSVAQLPFLLDPNRTPVMGSYSSGDQIPARLTSGWYALPKDFRSRPLLTFSVAGWFNTPDLQLEYTTDAVGPNARDAELTKTGTLDLIDPGPRPSWRNVRIMTDQIPADVTAVRIMAKDENLSQDQFMVVTPPRLPKLRTLEDVVGRTDPVHIDWTSGLVFPCQRPFDHHYGVAEIPKWRIKPGADLAAAVSAWQAADGGGPLGWLEVSQQADSLATYMLGDLGRDWGSLEKYTPYDDTATVATITSGTATRSGFWAPAPIRY
ncbi:arabinosyltransferase [Gordonia sp. TBRC 11910]|uniref:Arabinosyltransferase n=2 Tax=Gordonia asplenii TaxID=2725283 RepID=A0A848KXA5_9ACTN|nr:arabinosyltransferase [Gordonia asplenii]